MKYIQKPYKCMQDVLLRVGLIPPDTEFNRRAREYAKGARSLADNREQSKRNRQAREMTCAPANASCASSSAGPRKSSTSGLGAKLKEGTE